MGVTAKGLDGVIKLAQERAARARDLSPALRVAAEAVKTGIDDSFRQQQDFAGVAFAANAASTIKRKGSSVPAVDTGRFRSSITAQAVGKDTIRFGTNVPYAAPVIAGFIRRGTLKRTAYKPKREKGSSFTVRTPARNPFPVSPLGQWLGSQRANALLRKVGRIVTDYIQTGKL